MYHVDLSFQLYLDIDTTGGGPFYRSVAVFDPYRSIHAPKGLPWTSAFLNIAFDLVEMERRRLGEELRSPGLTIEQVRTLQHKHEARARDTITTYLRRTRKGFDIALLHDWNDQVKKALGIDNLAVSKAKMNLSPVRPRTP